MIIILASIAIVILLSIPIGLLVILGLALKVAYDIRERSLLERYVCVVYDIRKSKRWGGAGKMNIAYYYEEVKCPLEYLHILYIWKNQGKKV